MFPVLEALLSLFNQRTYRKRRLIFTNKYATGRRRRPLLLFTTILFGIVLWILYVNQASWVGLDLLKDDWWSDSPIWEEDRKPHLNPHAFPFLLDSPDACGKEESVDLLLMVTSAIAHFDRRMAIRSTWGSHDWRGSRDVKLIFLLGHGGTDQGDIIRENEVNNDIIQEDFKDTYYNLTLKTVMGLKWASIYCPQAKFVLKTDDDMFVSLPSLHSALQKDSHFLDHIVGCIKNSPNSAPQPIPSSPNLPALPQAHPAFVAGAGYLLPGGAYIRDLYYASLRTRFFAIEDVFTTAHVAARIGLHPPVHDFRFSCGEMSPINAGLTHLNKAQYCERLQIKFTEHKVKPQDMRALYDILNSDECRGKL